MAHPNGYTKEMIRELLGTSCPEHVAESGCEERKRKGREMRARGEKKTYPQNKKYVYPPGSGFNYMEYVNSHGGTENNKVS